jgi:hypothetical protein
LLDFGEPPQPLELRRWSGHQQAEELLRLFEVEQIGGIKAARSALIVLFSP